MTQSTATIEKNESHKEEKTQHHDKSDDNHLQQSDPAAPESGKNATATTSAAAPSGPPVNVWKIRKEAMIVSSSNNGGEVDVEKHVELITMEVTLGRGFLK